jgi:ElaB/YqjD/DUF883 family membrane-anchored ribosome-binding protein
MAKKTTANIDPQTAAVVSRLHDNMTQLQRDADSLLRRTQQQAVELISRDQRKALERLFKQAQRLRGDLEKRAQRASKDVESRAERFLLTLEKETYKRLGPVLKRFDVPTRDEVRGLSRRVAQLERKLEGAAKAPEAPARARKRAPKRRPAAPTTDTP